MDLFSVFVLLFLVMDPLGNVPLFLSALEPVAPERRARVLIRELLIALAAMFLFLLAGPQLLALLGLRQEAIGIAGAIILGIIAMKMIFPGARPDYADEPDGEPLVVPLAIPLLAGPSILATVLLLAGRDDTAMPVLAAGLFLAWAGSAVILLASGKLRDWLGRRGLIAMERLMGMVLVAIAVQMFLDGLRTALSG
ncbi:MAG: MarC family protein [Pseudomonadota bacterium]